MRLVIGIIGISLAVLGQHIDVLLASIIVSLCGGTLVGIAITLND